MGSAADTTSGGEDPGSVPAPRTSHRPSLDADLPGFEQFVASIGYGHFYGLGGQPEKALHAEPRPSVSPYRSATAAEAPPVRSGVWKDWAFAAVPVMMLAAVAGWPAVRDAFSERQARDTEDVVIASPFFTLEGFRSIRPGMTADDVRRLVGLPLQRGVLRKEQNGEAKQSWGYTLPCAGKDSPLPMCVVTLAGGRVTDLAEWPALRLDWRARLALAGPVQGVGDLRLRLENGQERVLHRFDGAPSLLVNRRYDIDVHALSGQIGPVLRVTEDVAGSLGILSPVSVYSAGILYGLPIEDSEILLETFKEDVEWLLARLQKR